MYLIKWMLSLSTNVSGILLQIFFFLRRCHCLLTSVEWDMHVNWYASTNVAMSNLQ